MLRKSDNLLPTVWHFKDYIADDDAAVSSWIYEQGTHRWTPHDSCLVSWCQEMTDSGNLVMRFSCSFKYGTSCHFESSHKNKILCMYISYALLKSVFPKIRVRTWVQVASDWLTYLVYQLETWFFGRNPLELMSWLWSQKKLNLVIHLNLPILVIQQIFRPIGS